MNLSTCAQFELRIHGMDCVEEVSLLKRELVPLLGEERLGFDVLNGKLTVNLGSANATREQVLAAIAKSGLKAEPWRDESTYEADLSFRGRHQRTILTAVSGVFGGAGLITQVATAVAK
jgi:Cd2+/Zn2+-exporting ATPase